jgi:hypothetical protein
LDPRTLAASSIDAAAAVTIAVVAVMVVGVCAPDNAALAPNATSVGNGLISNVRASLPMLTPALAPKPLASLPAREEETLAVLGPPSEPAITAPRASSVSADWSTDSSECV